MSLWDKRFLRLAEHISTWSKDPSTKVGAVIADPAHRIISVGFNGFPKYVKDDNRLDDREIKYKIILHAEENAILFARQSLLGCTIYIWPFKPCAQCASKIIQSDITRVVAPQEYPDRWKADIKLGEQLFKEAGIICD